VLVRVLAAGVCHSDWHLRTGATDHPLPVVAGHEGCGVVEAVGDGVTRVAPGDLVVLNWAPACGSCEACADGRPGLCATHVEAIWAGGLLDGTCRFRLDGRPVHHYSAVACFSERTVVPEQGCVPVPKDLPPVVGALIGCAVTTGVGAVLNTASVRAGRSAAVYGVGGVGLSTVIGLRLAGAGPVIAVDVTPEKVETALSVGATHGVVSGPGTTDEIRRLTGGRGAHYVFDTTGIPDVQEQCLDAARPGGSVILAGLAPMGSRTNLDAAALTRQEKTVAGTYYGTSVPDREFPLLAGLFLEGRIPLDRLVTRTYRLDQVNEAFEDMIAGRLSRGVIRFD
jgi:Zn-dependent alcohol dehydrogenase